MSHPPPFQSAVKIAREELSRGKESGDFDSGVAWKKYINLRALDLFADIRLAETSRDDLKDRKELQELGDRLGQNEIRTSFELKTSDPIIKIEWLISQAEDDSTSFDILTMVAAAYAETPVLMPEALGRWTAAVLRSEKKRPIRRGKFAEGTGLRNTHIWLTLKWLVQLGMTATRNDASLPTSACDAVAQALKQLGENPTAYASVKRIWNDFQRWRGPSSL
jgi:hypothetical protein